MTQYPFRTYDVFTAEPFGGNPLAVVLDAGGLTTRQMQTIAREFNYSETTFVSPPQTPDGTAHVRIFTPMREMAFAGHPTIGTAICLAEEALAAGQALPSRIVLEEGVGPISCTVENSATGLTATLTSDTPLEIASEVPRDLTASLLSLPETAVTTARHAPRFLSKGALFLIAELATSADLAAALPDPVSFREAAAQFPEAAWDVAVAAYHRNSPERIEMRMFAPLDGIPEDPATGSAAAALGAWLCHLESAPQRFSITQGVAMGRPSRIEVTAESAEPGASRVTVGGAAIRIMSGEIRGT